MNVEQILDIFHLWPILELEVCNRDKYNHSKTLPQLHRVVQVFFDRILQIRVVPLAPVRELQYPLISRSRNLVLFLGLQ